MRKFIWLLSITIFLFVSFIACSNKETYADKLKNERKEIDRFLKENDIVTLDKFPEVGYKFAENEYYKDAAGTYIRVIDWGNQDYMASPTKPNTRVSIRFANALFLGDEDPWTTTGSGADFSYMEIEYGDTSTYMGSYGSSSTSESLKYMFMSIPCVIPLEYVGDKGKVSLIIPFASGSTYQQSTAYKALYFEELRYVLLD